MLSTSPDYKTFLGYPVRHAVVGKLRGISVIYDPLMEDKILLGYKGDSALDNGYLYAPMMLAQGDLMIGPQSFEPRMVFHTRSGAVPLQAERYYRILEID